MKDSDKIVNDLRNNVARLIECNEQPIEEAGRKPFSDQPDGPLKTLREIKDIAQLFVQGDPICKERKAPATPDGWRMFFNTHGYTDKNSKWILKRIEFYYIALNKLFATFFKQVEEEQNKPIEDIDFGAADVNNELSSISGNTEEQPNI